MNKIGLKLANGEFYPVLDDGLPAKKRLTVTTVKDGQKSVQIDLYRGSGDRVIDAEYMGSLVIESITGAPAGDPDIALELELDAEGMLKAMAEVAGTGERQSLRISLEALSEERKYEIPDFDFEEDRTDTLPDEATSPEEGAGLLASASSFGDERKGRSPWFFVGAFLIIIAALALIYLVFQWASPSKAGAGAAVPALAAAPAKETPTTTILAAATTTTSSAATTTSTTLALAPATQAKAAPPSPSGGVLRYRIRWGDTLWDLAFVHYRDPWLYPRIAKANKIKNPDLILAGTWIEIPAR
ncbi:MAG: Hsp70 family protein [Spirochaetota bacterium]